MLSKGCESRALLKSDEKYGSGTVVKVGPVAIEDDIVNVVSGEIEALTTFPPSTKGIIARIYSSPGRIDGVVVGVSEAEMWKLPVVGLVSSREKDFSAEGIEKVNPFKGNSSLFLFNTILIVAPLSAPGYPPVGSKKTDPEAEMVISFCG